MDSEQLPEPDPPEPPDPPSAPVRASSSDRSITSCKPFTLCVSAGFSIISHFLLRSSSPESFMSLDLRFSQISVYTVLKLPWPSIFSLISSLKSSPRSISVVSLVFGFGSTSDLITAVCSLLSCVLSSPVRISLVRSVISLKFSKLVISDVVISMECSFKLSCGMFLAVVRAFTAVCSLFTVLCSSVLDIFKSFCDLLWQLDGYMSIMSTLLVNVVMDFYCPFTYPMKFVLSAISLSTFSGFVAGSKLLKITNASVIEVLIKGSTKGCLIAYVCVAILKIVNCALVAVSISGFISPAVIPKFQGFLSLCSLVVESRGPLYAISCLCVLYALIFYCLIVIVVCLARMALLSCSVNLFSFNGE